MNLQPGTLLHGGTYKIERELGQGSFGITYAATHTQLNKRVAIKEFFMKDLNSRSEDGSITGMSDGSLSTDYARKFRKEAINLSRLEHPNIVHVSDSFEDNGTYYYVMDYIDGQNLSDYLKYHRPSQQDAVDIIRDVAQALMYMHEDNHMLHLDLKPGNVMRRASDGHIFLIDFGLSKHYSSDGRPETSTTIGLGTPGYAPIEQSDQTKSGEFRPTIDVYALGATFYKILTGETPPVASELVSNEDLIAEKLQEHHITPQLSAIVVQAMCPSVKRRTQTVRELLASLPKWVTINSNSSDETNTPYSHNEQTIINRQPAKEETITGSPKKPTVDKREKANKPKESSNSFFGGSIASIFTLVILSLVLFLCLRNCGNKTTSDVPTAEDSITVDSCEFDSTSVDDTDSASVDSCAFDSVCAVACYNDSPPNSGYQELTYSDGSSYKGYMVNGQYDGQGTYCYPKEGYTYEGNWSNGARSGYGVEVWEKETRRSYMCRYEGNFKNGQRNGKGTAYFVGGTYQKGKWKNGDLVRVTEEGTWK